MCTVSVIPVSALESDARSIQLVCNRDEHRTRPLAQLPVRCIVDHRAAVMPIDPVSGGTWIAGTDAGLVFCLLNATPKGFNPRESDSRHRSRGTIIPALLHSQNLDHAAQLAADIRVDRFPPFTLLVLDVHRLVAIHADAHTVRIDPTRPIDRPMLYTSSGLGDHVVHEPRHALFSAMFALPAPASAIQQAFHEHRWSHLGALSVAMARADARTVSRTRVDLDSDRLRLFYSALDDALRPAHPPIITDLVLPLAEAVA